MLIPEIRAKVHSPNMRDWAFDYVLHVLEEKGWSMNRLANEIGVAASTINRPLRDPDWPHSLSRKTISKIWETTGIDPAPFIPEGFSEDRSMFSPRRPEDQAVRPSPMPIRTEAPSSFDQENKIRITLDGHRVLVDATVDRDGLAKLRQKLETIESLLD